MKWHRYLRQR